MSRLIDEMGNTYGRLTVVNKVVRDSGIRWVCECECGTVTEVIPYDLRSGNTKSCGCLQRDRVKECIHHAHTANTKYPLMDKKDLKEYMDYKGAVKYKYGLDEASLRRLLDSQKGCCAICNKSLDWQGRTFHIDHCHRSGVVRGLLCPSCNKLLGQAYEDVDILCKSIRYLRGEL